jgi:8-oxo-dGTP pyrophosphatase MutT (NUDIX family)
MGIYSQGNRGGAPLPSATTILVRDGAGLEVFLMRRHRAQSFMGGAYVFPGGRLDEADRAPELAGCAEGSGAMDAEELALRFCGVRELFEEAGVLLARRSGGEAIDWSDPEVSSRFQAYRHNLHAGGLTLPDLAEREDLIYSPASLVLYAHWITPEFESKRFSTRFFIVPLPPGQTAVHDEVELVDSLWLTPAAALARQRERSLMLMPPTLKTIEELALFPTVADLLAAARAKPVLTILPQCFKTESALGVILPHDPEYAIAEYKQPPRPGETSRLILKDGYWLTKDIVTQDEAEDKKPEQ